MLLDRAELCAGEVRYLLVYLIGQRSEASSGALHCVLEIYFLSVTASSLHERNLVSSLVTTVTPCLHGASKLTAGVLWKDNI